MNMNTQPSTTATKCPKGKAIFAATTPDGKTVTRSSGRTYSHALAVFAKAEPAWDERHWVHDFDGQAPEGFEVIYYGRRGDQDDTSVAMIGRRIADLPDRWSIYSFHGSAALAEKAAGQWGSVDGYRIVEATVVADRRGE